MICYTDTMPFICRGIFQSSDITEFPTANERVLYAPLRHLSKHDPLWVEYGIYIDERFDHSLIVNGWCQTWAKEASPLIPTGEMSKLLAHKWYKRGREVFLVNETHHDDPDSFYLSAAARESEFLERFLKDMAPYLRVPAPVEIEQGGSLQQFRRPPCPTP